MSWSPAGKGDARRPITGNKQEVQRNIDAFYARLKDAAKEIKPEVSGDKQ